MFPNATVSVPFRLVQCPSARCQRASRGDRRTRGRPHICTFPTYSSYRQCSRVLDLEEGVPFGSVGAGPGEPIASQPVLGDGGVAAVGPPAAAGAWRQATQILDGLRLPGDVLVRARLERASLP
jgi:hypothetical protein